MFRISARSLRAHARRFASTVIAVALGVAFLTGVLVQVATFQRSFDDMFAVGTAGTDAAVRAGTAIDLGFGDTVRGRIDAALVEQVAGVAGVAAVAPVRTGLAQIAGADGDVLGGGGPPQMGQQWIAVPELNPWVLVAGRAPAAPDEVVIDRASARQGDLAVGDTTRVFTPEPVTVTVVGVATYGSADSPGPLTVTLFDEAGAVEQLGSADEVDSILVAATPGVDQEELTGALRAVLPDGVEAVTGAALTEESQQIGRDFVGILRPALLAFALIALIVGAFSIYNTFAIVVAQRTRDAALLRALGASRAQVIGSTLVEATVVGLAGGLAGLAGGIALATGLNAVLSNFTGLGDTSLVVSAATIAIALAVGTGVTVAAALLPARRASIVPPVAALRDVAIDGGRVGRTRLAIGGAVLALGAGIGVQAAATGGGAGRGGIGAVLVLAATIVLAPAVAGPLVRVAGAPLARLRGVTGLMARRNAIRNPRRTGSTATALVIGVAVVALFTVLAASLRGAVDRIVDEQIAGDVVVQSQGSEGTVGLPPSLIAAVQSLPEVDEAVGIGTIPLHVDGEDRWVTFSDDAGFDRVVDLDIRRGDAATFAAGQIAVSTGFAERAGVDLGGTVPVRHLDGQVEDLRVSLVYDTTTLAGDVFVATATVAAHVPDLSPAMLLVTAAEGVTAEQLDDAAEVLARDLPSVQVQTREEYAETIGRSVDSMLVLIYVLLALSIGIALMGIANTISLSTIERRHEIGLLRAVGQTRRQVRSMVRWEAVLVATLGTVTGLAVGVSGAWMVLKAGGGDLDRVVVPGSLVVVALVGAAAGVLASARPAARAARTDVLTAIATA